MPFFPGIHSAASLSFARHFASFDRHLALHCSPDELELNSLGTIDPMLPRPVQQGISRNIPTAYTRKLRCMVPYHLS